MREITMIIGSAGAMGGAPRGGPRPRAAGARPARRIARALAAGGVSASGPEVSADAPIRGPDPRNEQDRVSTSWTRGGRLAACQPPGRAPTFPGMEAAYVDTPAGVIGHNIVAAREHLGISQGELARRLKIDRRQLSRWELGGREPGARSLHAIGIQLGRSIEWFLYPHEQA